MKKICLFMVEYRKKRAITQNVYYRTLQCEPKCMFFFSLKLSAAHDQNIRRENKLYSYKEQMEELELRKVGRTFWGYNFALQHLPQQTQFLGGV